MVALYPDAATAAELAIAGGEDHLGLHLTLGFLGKAADLDFDAAVRAVIAWAECCPETLDGEISGVGQFAEGPVTYLSVDLPDLPALRQDLVEKLNVAGVPPKTDHGYTPHMTLDYARRRPKINKAIPISFGRVTLTWAGQRHAFPLGTPLTPVAEAALLEGKWDPTLHPRWPKGTPRAGEFIKVGQRFHSPDGKEWVVSHVAGGRVVANRAEGKYKEAETGVFSPAKVKGAMSPLEGGEETHVIADAVKEATPKLVKGGKEKSSTVAIVDPYVDSSSHDPSIPIPKGAKIGAEEWQRFGRTTPR